MPLRLSEAEALQAERAAFRGGIDPEVLAWILNECGLMAQKPEAVRPELVAFANRLLGKLGVVHPYNILEVTRKLLEASNDVDIEMEKKNERPAE